MPFTQPYIYCCGQNETCLDGKRLPCPGCGQSLSQEQLRVNEQDSFSKLLNSIPPPQQMSRKHLERWADIFKVSPRWWWTKLRLRLDILRVMRYGAGAVPEAAAESRWRRFWRGLVGH